MLPGYLSDRPPTGNLPLNPNGNFHLTDSLKNHPPVPKIPSLLSPLCHLLTKICIHQTLPRRYSTFHLLVKDDVTNANTTNMHIHYSHGQRRPLASARTDVHMKLGLSTTQQIHIYCLNPNGNFHLPESLKNPAPVPKIPSLLSRPSVIC